MSTDSVMMRPEHGRLKHTDQSGHRSGRHFRFFKLLFQLLLASALLGCGLFSVFGFLESFEPGNGLT